MPALATLSSPPCSLPAYAIPAQAGGRQTVRIAARFKMYRRVAFFNLCAKLVLARGGSGAVLLSAAAALRVLRKGSAGRGSRLPKHQNVRTLPR